MVDHLLRFEPHAGCAVEEQDGVSAKSVMVGGFADEVHTPEGRPWSTIESRVQFTNHFWLARFTVRVEWGTGREQKNFILLLQGCLTIETKRT